MTQRSRARTWMVGSALALALSSACTGTSSSLTVQLASDMTPGIELDAARVAITHDDGTSLGDPTEVALPIGRSLGRPIRLVLVPDLAPATYRVSVELVRGGRTVQSRALRVRVEGNVVRTLLMTRDCGGVACPGTGDASAVACLGGRCVDPACTEEDPTSCGTHACASDSDCPASAVACAPSRCTASGACIASADDALCAADEICDVQAGCQTTRARCDWTSPTFSAPEVMLDMPWREASIGLSHDGLDLYFAEEFGPTSTVWTAHRAALDQPFGAPRTLDELHTPGQLEGSFAFRRDGLEVVYSRQPLAGSELADLYAQRRVHASDPWGVPDRLAGLDTSDYEFDSFLEPDGLTLWFERQDAVNADLFRATRARLDLPFGPPAMVPGLSMPGRVEANPSLPDDGSVVLVTTGGAMLDLAYAPMTAGTPGALVSLDALNSSANDAEPFVRFDGCEVLFVSSRSGDGGAAIFRSTLSP